MKIKFYLSALLLVICGMFFLASCGDDDKPEDETGITVPPGTNVNQTAQADDETSGDGGFAFTATEPWTATIKETTTRNNSVSWIRVLINGEEKYTGQAGTFNITFELDVNYSGAPRTASIVISSKKDFTFTITQKETKQDGTKPEIPKLVTEVKSVSDNPLLKPLEYLFKYDEKTFRLKEFWAINNINTTYTYLYNYDILNEIRITCNKNDNVYSAPLNDKGYASELRTDTDSRKIVLYNENNYVRRIGNRDKWVWSNNNLLGIEDDYMGDDDEEEEEDDEEEDIIENPNKFAKEVNDKTNIDLNFLLFQMTSSTPSYDEYEAEINLFALADKLGKRSKNYMVWSDEDYPVDASEDKVYSLETEPKKGEVGSSTATERHGDAVYEFDNEGYPISLTQKIKITQTEFSYNGKKEYVEPRNEHQKEEWEHTLGPGPWFKIIIDAKSTSNIGTTKFAIKYNK